MNKTVAFSRTALAAATALALAACGHSSQTPNGQANPGASGTGAAAYTPATGSFASADAASLQGRTTVSSCNVDDVNGKPAGDSLLQLGSSATFTGWAADGEAGTVPSSVELFLKGPQDYSLAVPTGMARPDVAAATSKPALAHAGWSVNANMAAVAAATYTPVLLFTEGGKHFACETAHQITVR